MKQRKNKHQSSDARRRDIIEAALETFTESGFTAASMSEIGKRAGASIGSMYHHFKGKEQLAAALYMEGIIEYQKGLVAALKKEDKAEKGIRAITAYHLTWVKSHRQWALFLFRNRNADFMEGTDEEFDRLNKTFATEIGAWFAQQIERGSIKQLPWDILISAVLGPCQEFSRLYLSGKAVTPVEKAVELLSQQACKSLVEE